MKKVKLTGFSILIFSIILCIFYFNKASKSNLEIILNNKNLEIIFPYDIQVTYYEIADYESKETIKINEPSAYKRLIKQQYIANTSKITINNYENLNIQTNHAYFFLMAQDNDKEPNRPFKSIGFCIKNNQIIQQKYKESETSLIQKCHK